MFLNLVPQFNNHRVNGNAGTGISYFICVTEFTQRSLFHSNTVVIFTLVPSNPRSVSYIVKKRIGNC